ncbi:WAT1-related protein At1g21890-like [Cornus florida]|uniref:WAT1-related protein At1g21890-like n=1 Tax=Cornus florida TaxID=4283 RepID=UPI0028A221A6|nr:WAT1-related protein At1g21890-like [Cornus florida]
MGDQKPSAGMLSRVYTKLKPYLAMISLQFGYAGMYIITMVTLNQGMNHYVLVVYRHAVATLVMAPFALVLESKIRPKLTFPILMKIMVLGLLEPVIDQNFVYLGMQYTSATFASATVNVLPAITFIMALIFRMERVNLKKIHSIAKIIGTIITVSGAMVMTLYKGPILDIIGNLAQGNHHAIGNGSASHHWVLGTVLLLARTFGWSGFFILQSITLKDYPAQLSLTTLICLMGTLQGSAVAFVMERDMSAWVVGWDLRLLAAVYSGVVCSGIAYYVQGVVNRERGPVFVTAFSPLCMIITAVLEAIVLAVPIRLGSLIGAVVIVLGLYFVVWGKSKDPSLSSGKIMSEEGEANELPIVDKTRSAIADGSGK